MEKGKGFVREVDITPGQRESIRNLQNSPDFDALKLVVEDMIQALSFDLVVGTGTDEELLARLRINQGSYQLWRTITNLIDGNYEKPGEN